MDLVRLDVKATGGAFRNPEFSQEGGRSGSSEGRSDESVALELVDQRDA